MGTTRPVFAAASELPPSLIVPPDLHVAEKFPGSPLMAATRGISDQSESYEEPSVNNSPEQLVVCQLASVYSGFKPLVPDSSSRYLKEAIV